MRVYQPSPGIQVQPELVEQRLMGQKVDVFYVIVSLVLSLCLLLRLSWVNALENT